MDQSSNLELRATTARPRLRDRAILWAHREAERRDRIPAEFGAASPVDTSDADAVLREWIRQARLWADYNPEEMLALKAGAAVLGGALLVLIVLIRAIR